MTLIWLSRMCCIILSMSSLLLASAQPTREELIKETREELSQFHITDEKTILVHTAFKLICQGYSLEEAVAMLADSEKNKDDLYFLMSNKHRPAHKKPSKGNPETEQDSNEGGYFAHLWSIIKNGPLILQIIGAILILVILYYVYCWLSEWFNFSCHTPFGLVAGTQLSTTTGAVDNNRLPIESKLLPSDEVSQPLNLHEEQSPLIPEQPKQENNLTNQVSVITEVVRQIQQQELSSSAKTSNSLNSVRALLDRDLCEKIEQQVELEKKAGMEPMAFQFDDTIVDHSIEQRGNRKFDELIIAVQQQIKDVGMLPTVLPE